MKIATKKVWLFGEQQYSLGRMVVALVLLLAASARAQDPVLFIEGREDGSCPYLYSWDGSSYQLENDLYSVGRGAANEFTDYLLLNKPIAAKDGVYSFEIKDVVRENSWTDALQLIVIDHPASVGVGVDETGAVHSYSNPIPPASAVDGDGNDVLALVSAKQDGVGFAASHNDVVVLDFSSVDISTAAKLVLAVDGFEGDSRGPRTGQVPAVQIQTLQGGAWVTRHAFVPKEFWAEGVFDLQPYLGESRSVRLVSVSCDEGKNHVIDYAALDNTVDTLTATVLAPASAVINGTTDVLAEISASDDVYAATTTGDVLAVTFPVPPLVDEARNVVVASEGYYVVTGNSFYIDTWDGSSWVNRGFVYNVGVEAMMSFPLSVYLPDPDGEFKVRIWHQWSLISGTYAEIDQLLMVAWSAVYPPSSALETGTIDILPQLVFSDDYRWSVLGTWAIVQFPIPVTEPTSTPTYTPTRTDTPTPTSTPTSSNAVCAAAPLASCSGTSTGSLKLKGNSDATKKKLIWKWLKATADLSDFGDPGILGGDTNYRLCVYDDGVLKMNPAIAAGGTCDGEPCWQTAGATGIKYKNTAGNAAGITMVKMKAGAGNAKIIVKGKGSGLSLPFPITDATAVTVQLVKNPGSGPECWELKLPAPAKANDTTKELFLDKIP